MRHSMGGETKMNVASDFDDDDDDDEWYDEWDDDDHHRQQQILVHTLSCPLFSRTVQVIGHFATGSWQEGRRLNNKQGEGEHI